MQINLNRIQNQSIQRKAGGGGIIPRVNCPKFPKGKDEGWFLTLGDPFNGELIALKRCAYRNYKSSHQISFITPERIGNLALFSFNSINSAKNKIELIESINL